MKKISLIFSVMVFILGSISAQDMWNQNKKEGFIKNLYLKNMMEIQISQLAFTKNVNAEVRDLGMMIVQDHGKANNMLNEVAKSMNIKLRDEMTAKHKNKVDKFHRLDPVDFRDKYIDMLVQEHKKTIGELEEAKAGINNEEFSNWVDKVMPLMKNHLESAKEMQDMRRGKTKAGKMKTQEAGQEKNTNN